MTINRINPSIGVTRMARYGPGAIFHLSDVFHSLKSNKIVLLTSPSFSDEQYQFIRSIVGVDLPHMVIPRVLTEENTEELKKRTSLYKVAIAIGGGNVMDGAKGLLIRDDFDLLLIPTTLSGSEQSGNTTYWSNNQKVVLPVKFAQFVIADPALLVSDELVLRAGAMHALAHVLATVKTPGLSNWQVRVSAFAAKDLLSAILSQNFLSDMNRLKLLQGAWGASTSFIMTGPRIAGHHFLVHKLAGPSDHAQFSATLLARSLTQSKVHQDAIGALSVFIPEIFSTLNLASYAWLKQAKPLEPIINPEAVTAPKFCAGEVAELSKLI